MKKLTKTIIAAGAAVAAFGARADAPRYGGLYFDAAVEIDGVVHPAGTTVYAETWPTQMLVRPVVASGQTFQWYRTDLPRATYLNAHTPQNSFYGSLSQKFPNVRLSRMDGAYLMTPPGDASVVVTNRAVCAQKVVYVSAADGDDATATGGEAAPFGTIQGAVDHLYANARNQNAIVLVKPGVYDRGGYEGDADTFRSRVFVQADQPVLIKSTGGASVTVIEGELDPDSADGCGAAARRCVTFKINNGGDACLQGFTFRKGRTADSTGGQLYTNQGGGIAAQRSNYGISQHIAADCVFEDCRAGYGNGYAAAWNMWLFRCRVTGCTAWPVSSSYCVATVVSGADAGGLGGFSFQSSAAGGCGIVAVNSVAGKQRLGPEGFYYGTVLTKNGQDGENFGWTSPADAYVVRLETGDVRPAAGGAAQFGAATPEAGTDDWRFWSDVVGALACGDVDGNPVAWRDGVPMSGAIMQTVQLRTVSVAKPATVGVTATGLTLGDTGASAILAEGEAITLAPNETGSRYAAGVVCGGVTNLFADLPGGVFSYTVAKGDGALAIEILRSDAWYADAVNGDDANTGFTRASAVKTLVCGMRKCASGDTLYALPGVYDEGVTDRSGNATPDASRLACRAFIRCGATLASTDGPEKTVILGAAATSADADEYGRGSNAVSCVRVQSANSAASAVTLRGFTLTGGRTRYEAGNNDGNEQVNGAAFHALWSSRDYVTLENCIVTNNFSQHQAVSSDTTCIGCVFDANVADSSSATFKSRLLGCLVKSGGAHSIYGIRNCTFGTNTTMTLEGGYYECVNSLMMGQVNWHGNEMTFTNCVFLSGTQRYRQVDCQILGRDAIGIDDDYRPTSAASPLVDAAKTEDAADARLVATPDAAGGQRVYNGAADIGAFEYDWRAIYAKDLRRAGGFSVTDASPAVVEGDARAVVVPAGASVTGTWLAGASHSARANVRVRLSGAGVFTVSVNGAAVATLTGPAAKAQEVAVSSLAGDVVTFAYRAADGADAASAGEAVIEKIAQGGGLLLIVR